MKIKRDRKYYETLDETLEFIPLTMDSIFKKIFKKNLPLLKRFLFAILDFPQLDEDCSIYLEDGELVKSQYHDRQNRVDIYVILNNSIHCVIEVNSEKFDQVLRRNILYVDKLKVNLAETGTAYEELDQMYVYQINLNAGEQKKKYNDALCVLYDQKAHQVIDNHTQIVTKNLAYYQKLYYTNSITNTDEIIWLAGLASKSFTELYDIYKQVLSETELNCFMKEVVNMMRKTVNLHEWQREKFDAWVKFLEEEERRKEKEEWNKERNKSKKEIINQKKEITNQKKEITNQKKEITNQKKEITNQKKEITNQKKEITNQKKEITNQREIITKYKKELNNTKKQVNLEIARKMLLEKETIDKIVLYTGLSKKEINQLKENPA